METLNECLENVRLSNLINSTNDYFGVFYYSKSNPKNHHYVVLKNMEEFKNLKQFHREYDYIFNVLTK
jgi:hypothetical protein